MQRVLEAAGLEDLLVPRNDLDQDSTWNVTIAEERVKGSGRAQR